MLDESLVEELRRLTKQAGDQLAPVRVMEPKQDSETIIGLIPRLARSQALHGFIYAEVMQIDPVDITSPLPSPVPPDDLPPEHRHQWKKRNYDMEADEPQHPSLKPDRLIGTAKVVFDWCKAQNLSPGLVHRDHDAQEMGWYIFIHWDR